MLAGWDLSAVKTQAEEHKKAAQKMSSTKRNTIQGSSGIPLLLSG